MQECAKRIAKVSAEAKLETDEETYLSSFKPHLMDVYTPGQLELHLPISAK